MSRFILLADALNNGLNVTKPIISTSDVLVEGSKFLVTALGGIAVKVTNGTGVATVKGSVIAVSTTTASRFILQSNEFDAFGIVYESGVADGSEAWVIIQGVAEVLWKNSTTATKGYVALSADTDGRAVNVAVPSGNPVAAEHFKEIGHVMEDNSGGTNQLVKVILHFN